ncbi:MAG TPA: hypothetical protein PLP29_14455 [Candidatus Ozemobacteraceae bacterium]|nr:hypothetical protein [Candidatus Ozemobacteraceae bacterium]
MRDQVERSICGIGEVKTPTVDKIELKDGMKGFFRPVAQIAAREKADDNFMKDLRHTLGLDTLGHIPIRSSISAHLPGCVEHRFRIAFEKSIGSVPVTPADDPAAPAPLFGKKSG